MTKKLNFDEFCNLNHDAWKCYVQTYYEEPQDSLLAQMVQEYVDDNRLFSQENRHLWLNLIASTMPELLAYLALVSYKRGSLFLGWFLDAIEASLSLLSEGSETEVATDYIFNALKYLSAPHDQCSKLLPLFSSPPQETALINNLKVTWLEVFRQVSDNPSDYCILYNMLYNNKRTSEEQATNPVTKKEKIANILTPSYFQMTSQNQVTTEWVELCLHGLALWQDTAAILAPNAFQGLVTQLISNNYPGKKLCILDCVLGLWMLTQPERALWVLEPLILLINENSTPGLLFIKLFDPNQFPGFFGPLLAQNYSTSQMEAMALRVVHQSLTLMLSCPKDKINRAFLGANLGKISPIALESIAQWGVGQLDNYVRSNEEVTLIHFENVMDYLPIPIMLRQLLLLLPDAPKPTMRLEMTPRLNPNISTLLWGVGTDSSLSLGASHQLVLAMIQDNAAFHHPDFPDFLAGVLRLMVTSPPASLLSLHKWTNHYLIPTILSKHSLNPDYASALLVALLRDITLFGMLMGGHDLRTPSLTAQMDLTGITVSPQPGLKAFLTLLSSELDTGSQLSLAQNWITLWKDNSPVLWKWKMTLASCYPLSSLSANIAAGLLETTISNDIPCAISDLCGLMKFTLVTQNCAAMFPLVYQALQRISSISNILFCIEDVLLSSYIASSASTLDSSLMTKSLDSLTSVLNTCINISEDQHLQTQLLPQMAVSITLHQTLLSILVLSWYELSKNGPFTLNSCQPVHRFFHLSCKLLTYFLVNLESLDCAPAALEALYNIPSSAHHPNPLLIVNLELPTSRILYSKDLNIITPPLVDKLVSLFPQSPLIPLLNLNL